MKYELHFAEKDLQEDIKCYKVANQSDLINLINGYGEAPKMLGNFSKHKEVYLCAIELYHNDNDGIIFVDDKPEYIVSFIKDNTNTPTMKKIFLQVYESYEEA